MKIVDYLIIEATICIGREILCLPYAGFKKKYNTININIGKVDKAAVGVDGCLTKWIRFFFVIFRHFLGHFWLSISQFAHMCVCVSVCVSLCSLLRYSLNLFLPPIP